MKITMRHLPILLLLSASVFGTLAPAQTLLYSVNLRTYGCPVAERKPFTWESELSAGTWHVGFDRTGKVYVGCAIQGEAKLLKPGEGNNIFRVLIIDAESGKVTRKLDFPTQSKERTGINISANNSLLVIANDKVQLLGEDGSARETFDIPIDGEKQYLVTDESVSGKTFLVLARGASGNFPYFFRADTLSLVAHCEIPVSRYGRDYPATIADNVQMKEFQNSYVKGGPLPWDRLVIGPFCGHASDLWAVDPGVEPFLLDDSTVLEMGRSKRYDYTSVFEVRKIDGASLWSQELPKHFLVEGGPVSNGSRFAIEIGELHGGHRALDIGAKVVSSGIWIYDAMTGKRVGSIQVPPNSRFEYALSPGGDKVGILSLNDGTLEVWKL
jgi:hypothetical protein